MIIPKQQPFERDGPLDTNPHSFLALCVLVFVLGLRHGLDADHLASIDGLTRFNNRANPRIAKLCGVLFSVGHGAIVVGVAATVSLLADRWTAPGFLAQAGAWISIGFLFVLGIANLAAALRARDGDVVQPIGFKGRIFGRLNQASRPAAVALVGALFAISLDTVSQASLFAVMATQFGGFGAALTLALLFAIAMVFAGGLNGLWISHLLHRTDGLAAVASRVMSFAVALLSIAVAALGTLKLLSPAFDSWTGDKELAFGLGVVGLVAVSFLVALATARNNSALPAAD